MLLIFFNFPGAPSGNGTPIGLLLTLTRVPSVSLPTSTWNYGATRVGIRPLGFPIVPPLLSSSKEHRRQISDVVNRLNQAKFNATVDVTLNPSATTTTLIDARIGVNSAICPAHALTADGAAAIAAGIWISGVVKGQCTINHASSANTDQNIRFTILG